MLLRQVVEDRRRGGPLVSNRIGGLIQMDQAASDERALKELSVHTPYYLLTL